MQPRTPHNSLLAEIVWGNSTCATELDSAVWMMNEPGARTDQTSERLKSPRLRGFTIDSTGQAAQFIWNNIPEFDLA